jgi:2-deoxy-D-gluconate 3-dehydrogenase
VTGPADVSGIPRGRALDGQVAVVTGASRGIGRAIALALGRAGAHVALVGRDEEALADTAKLLAGEGCHGLPIPADLTDSAQVEQMVAVAVGELGGVHILVNNAGVHRATPLLSTTSQEWDELVGANLGAAFSCMREVGRHLTAQNNGKIVNIASNWAFKGVTGYAAYSAAKSGLVALTRTAAVEWARHNVQVNAVAPGYVDTDMSSGLQTDANMLDRVLKAIPARRIGLPGEVASLVTYLASPQAAYITGQTISIDGGSSATS